MRDCLIVGAGPAGTTAASVLARAGRDVLALEAETFPRFHVGESMLPAVVPIWKKIGLWEKLLPLGFPVKRGADFIYADGSRTTPFWFASWLREEHHIALQVERSRFDEAAMKHARSCGAEVREGCRVQGVTFLNPGVEVTYRDPSGATQTERAKAVLDCSGNTSFLGRKLGHKKTVADLTKVALFAHYENVVLPDGEREGNISVVVAEDVWYWIIPLSIDGKKNRTSIGAVVDKSLKARWGGDPAELMDRLFQASSVVRERIVPARRISPVHVAADYTNRCEPSFGDGWALVGDAAAFLDPVFSTGFCLSQRHAVMAAEAVIGALKKRGRVVASDFAGPAKTYFRAVDTYTKFVRWFYTKASFHDLFMANTNAKRIKRAVVQVLGGDVDGESFWLRVFFLLVRLQEKITIVPRLPRPRITDGIFEESAVAGSR